MSDSAFTLFQARAMLWCHVKGRDSVGAAWWSERLLTIAGALLTNGYNSDGT
jgi:hypothetical protein